MTKTLGPIFQTAYVVADLDSAARFWTDAMGAGPLFITRNLQLTARYKGKPTSFAIDLALGFWGEVQVELIQQMTDGASPYRGPWDGTFQTLHHLGVLSSDTVADAKGLEAKGYPQVFDLEAGSGYISYHDTAGGRPGGLVELLPAAMVASDRIKRMKAASVNWDGRNGLRDAAELLR